MHHFWRVIQLKLPVMRQKAVGKGLQAVRAQIIAGQMPQAAIHRQKCPLLQLNDAPFLAGHSTQL